jgi:hypothetical protein
MTMARILFFLLLSVTVSYAQQGHPFLNHYNPSAKSSLLCFDLKQTAEGLMLASCREGLFIFDGRIWQRIASKENVFVTLPSKDKIWVAGENFIGYLKNNYTKPGYTIQVIKKQEEANFTGIYEDNQFVYFTAEQSVWLLDKKTNQPKQLNLNEGENVEALLLNKQLKNPLLKTKGHVYEIVNQELSNKKVDEAGINLITATLQQWLIYTANEKFLIGKPNNWKALNLIDQQSIIQSVPITLYAVNEKTLAIGTIHNGLFLVDVESGKTIEHIHYGTGLPDNEIFCLTTDRENNIWVAHEYGFTQIASHIPLHNYTYYPGLSGNIQTTANAFNALYVGTSTGLYKLQPRKTVLEWLEPVKIKTNKKENISASQEEVSKKKGFFSFLKKKKTQEIEKPTVEETSEKIIYVKRKIEQSDGFEFAKIPEIQTKISFLYQSNDVLYAAGPAGIYTLTTKGKPEVLHEEAIEYCKLLANNTIIFQNSEGDVYSLKGKTKAKLFSTTESIQSATATNDGIWLAGIRNLYSFSANGLKSYRYSNSQNDATAMITKDDKPFFCNSDGFFVFSNNAVRMADTTKRADYFFAVEDMLLTKSENTWQIDGEKIVKMDLRYLNLIEGIRKIEFDINTKLIWIISDKNELFSLASTNNNIETIQYPLLVKSVEHNKQYLPNTLRKFEFIQSERIFNMDVTRPCFSNAKELEYRFWLEGIEGSEWSPWSSNSNINFPFLPLGKYKLHVQTRDALHEQPVHEVFELSVRPPLWKTPWFYASQFLLFGILVIISIRLKAMNNRYRIFAQLLSVLTIVLLITFIQTVFSTYLSTSSPVIDFGIQVGIALLVLPIELYLRKLMSSDLAAEKLKSIIK